MNQRNLSCDNLMNNLPVGVALIDKDLRIVNVNHTMSRLLCEAPEQLTGQLCYRALERREEICPHCPGRSGGKSPVQVEAELRRQDGSLFSARMTATVLRDGAGEIVGYLKMVEDITDRRHLQQQLALSEARYRALFEKSGDYLFVVNIDPQRGPIIADANSAAFSSHGYTREEMIGMSVFALDSEEARRSNAGREELFHKPGDHFLFESEHVRKDGSKFPVEVSATMVQVGEAPPFLLCVERDISERKQAEVENRRLQEQLRQAEKMEALGQLTGGIAHDFNNQLTAILGFAELLEMGLEKGLLKSYAERIRFSAQNSADLIGQLMTFSRKGRIRSGPVSIHRTIGEVVQLLERSLGKKICVRQSFRAPRATVVGDATQLQNALLNIAINARDAMPDGGELRFETDLGAPPAGLPVEVRRDLRDPCLRISVEDTGVGIDATIRPRIFDPFFTTKKVGEGTGMGLACVYGTIQAHRGHIEVESEPGRGTRFSLYLPLDESAEVTLGQESHIRLPEGLRVMLVDDEPVVRAVASEMLLKQGCRIVEFRNGREALASFRKEPAKVDLAILDFVMPELNGTEILQAMRGLNPRLPVVLCSGHGLNREIRQALENDRLAFVAKPYSLQELLGGISQALG